MAATSHLFATDDDELDRLALVLEDEFDRVLGRGGHLIIDREHRVALLQM